MRFKDVLDKGITFDSPHPPLTPQDIAKLETLIQDPLPDQYRDFLLHSNGGKINCHMTPKDIDGYATLIHWPKDNGMFPDEEYAIAQYLHNMQDIIDYYQSWKHSLPEHTLVIGTDPGTTFYLIGFGPENKGKIYAWYIVGTNRMEDPDTAGYAYTGFIADSFVEFLTSLQSPELVI